MFSGEKIFDKLEAISERPAPFQVYTTDELWTDDHTSAQMLACHLNEAVDLSSRNAKFIRRSVEWILSRFRAHAGMKIADFGCGPGLYTTALARRRLQVTGIDFSKRSIDYAKAVAAREQLDIDYVVQNYLNFETEERFDLVLMIMCDFCALSPVQRKKMLRQFHKVLKPGGAVLLDVYTLSAFERREEEATYGLNLLNGFWSPDKYYGFLNIFKYDEEKVVLDKYTIVERDRTRTVYNWLQYFSPDTLEREFVAEGFSVEALYGDVAGTPYDSGLDEFAVIARKR